MYPDFNKNHSRQWGAARAAWGDAAQGRYVNAIHNCMLNHHMGSPGEPPDDIDPIIKTAEQAGFSAKVEMLRAAVSRNGIGECGN